MPASALSLHRFTLIAAVITLVAASTANAATVYPANLEQQIRSAANIFTGTCLNAQPTQIPFKDHFLPAVAYRFRIKESLKGNLAGEVTIFHFGWPRSAFAAQAGSHRRTPPGIGFMPEYRPGQEYLLFLTAPSGIGLCSPVGLSQSSFETYPDASGKQAWKNGIDNRGLFRGLSTGIQERVRRLEIAAPEETAPVLPYRDFLELLRFLIREIH